LYIESPNSIKESITKKPSNPFWKLLQYSLTPSASSLKTISISEQANKEKVCFLKNLKMPLTHVHAFSCHHDCIDDDAERDY